jgi:hypothetical protein
MWFIIIVFRSQQRTDLRWYEQKIERKINKKIKDNRSFYKVNGMLGGYLQNSAIFKSDFNFWS